MSNATSHQNLGAEITHTKTLHNVKVVSTKISTPSFKQELLVYKPPSSTFYTHKLKNVKAKERVRLQHVFSGECIGMEDSHTSKYARTHMYE